MHAGQCVICVVFFLPYAEGARQADAVGVGMRTLVILFFSPLEDSRGIAGVEFVSISLPFLRGKV
jgi:hypothetical protein